MVAIAKVNRAAVTEGVLPLQLEDPRGAHAPTLFHREHVGIVHVLRVVSGDCDGRLALTSAERGDAVLNAQTIDALLTFKIILIVVKLFQIHGTAAFPLQHLVNDSGGFLTSSFGLVLQPPVPLRGRCVQIHLRAFAVAQHSGRNLDKESVPNRNLVRATLFPLIELQVKQFIPVLRVVGGRAVESIVVSPRLIGGAQADRSGIAGFGKLIVERDGLSSSHLTSILNPERHGLVVLAFVGSSDVDTSGLGFALPVGRLGDSCFAFIPIHPPEHL